jgi:CheY-like chemotaxis protein
MTKILVVDDNAFQRKKIISIIEQTYDFEIHQAGDGEEALKIVEEISPDIIFCDIVMPNMDGVEFLSESIKKYPTIPVVMLTSDTESSQKDRCRELGAKAFLGKPPTKEKLTLVISKILNI